MTHTKHHVDHTHCWEEDNPPCGQKIEHLKCCLCEKLNPKIATLTDKVREETLQECFDSASVAKDTLQLKGWIKEELQALNKN